VITPQAWITDKETLLSDSEVLTLPGGFEPATPKSLARPRATRLSGQLPCINKRCYDQTHTNKHAQEEGTIRVDVQKHGYKHADTHMHTQKDTMCVDVNKHRYKQARWYTYAYSQEDTMRMDHWWLVVAAPLNFTHKAGCAAVLGAYGLNSKSWEQVGLLVAFQVRGLWRAFTISSKQIIVTVARLLLLL